MHDNKASVFFCHAFNTQLFLHLHSPSKTITTKVWPRGHASSTYPKCSLTIYLHVYSGLSTSLCFAQVYLCNFFKHLYVSWKVLCQYNVNVFHRNSAKCLWKKCQTAWLQSVVILHCIQISWAFKRSISTAQRDTNCSRCSEHSTAFKLQVSLYKALCMYCTSTLLSFYSEHDL